MIADARFRSVARLAGLLLLLSALGGCASTGRASLPRSAPVIELRANTGAVESAPVLIAARDYYPGGLEVGSGAIPNLVDAPYIPGVFDPGPADIATHAETQALRYSVDHPEIRIILTATEGHYRIVARRSAGITAVSDLRGKRIGTLPDTSAEFFVHRMLEGSGMTLQDVVIKRVAIRDMARSITSGEVDAVAIWDPYGENAARLLGGDLITFSDASAYRELFNLNTTSDRLADPAKRAAIVRFVRAVIDASADMRADPAQAQQLVAERTGFPLDEVVSSWPHLTFPAAIPSDLIDVMMAEERWLAERAGRTPRPRAVLEQLIDRSVYEEALALEK